MRRILASLTAVGAKLDGCGIIASMITALACMDDLIFLSKIVEATKALSLPMRSVKSAEKLIAACRDSGRVVVILDLDDQRLDAIALAQAVRSAEPPIDARIYAFVSHVNEARIQAAGPTLFDQVFSRGQFVRVLPELLATASGARP